MCFQIAGYGIFREGVSVGHINVLLASLQYTYSYEEE